MSEIREPEIGLKLGARFCVSGWVAVQCSKAAHNQPADNKMVNLQMMIQNIPTNNNSAPNG